MNWIQQSTQKNTGGGKEELNFEELQEGNNLLLKSVPDGFITGKKKSSSKNHQKLSIASSSIILPLITRVKQKITHEFSFLSSGE